MPVIPILLEVCDLRRKHAICAENQKCDLRRKRAIVRPSCCARTSSTLRFQPACQYCPPEPTRITKPFFPGQNTHATEAWSGAATQSVVLRSHDSATARTEDHLLYILSEGCSHVRRRNTYKPWSVYSLFLSVLCEDLYKLRGGHTPYYFTHQMDSDLDLTPDSDQMDSDLDEPRSVYIISRASRHKLVQKKIVLVPEEVFQCVRKLVGGHIGVFAKKQEGLPLFCGAWCTICLCSIQHLP